MKLGTFTEYDDGLLELACRTWSQIAELETLLRRDGYMVTSGMSRKANPCCAGLDRARALMHKMLADLGLSPPSRERLTLAPPSGDDPAERYFK